MTLWQRFYKAAGGNGPGDPIQRTLDANPSVAEVVALMLIRLGFLRRDPAMKDFDASWLYNFQWQWKFWRGPYRDAALAMGFPPPRWRDSWKRP